MPTHVTELRADVANFPTRTSAVEVGIAVLCMIGLAAVLIALSVLLDPAEVDLQSIGPLMGP
jgi:hypothetical protein